MLLLSVCWFAGPGWTDSPALRRCVRAAGGVLHNRQLLRFPVLCSGVLPSLHTNAAE